MRNTREIVRQKWLLKRPHRAISESVGVSVGAVSLALERATEAQLTWEGIESLDDAELEARLYPTVVAAASRPEPDCTWVHRERHRPGVTLELLHHEYLEQHPDGLRYTTFCNRYRTWLGRRGLVMRQVHIAGDKAFVDYSGKKARIVDPTTGEVIEVELFVATLGASNLTYAEASTRSAAPTDREPRAGLRVLRRSAGGAGAGPAEVRRVARVSVRTGGAAHVRGARAAYGTTVLPARPLHPRDKAKVEVAVHSRAMVARPHPRRGVPLDRRAERAPA